jgi:hypothetical protein
MHVTGVRSLAVAAVALAVMVWAGAAVAATGRPVAGTDHPPDEAVALRSEGTLCRADSKSFRVWWSDARAATAGGALVGSDGSCATLPPTAQGTLDAAEAVRAIAIGRGFPALIGDPPAKIPRDRVAYRRLLRLRPAARGRALSRLRPAVRGRLLAGFTPNQRRVILRGLTRPLRARLTREATVAAAGRPRDFVGGDPRLDIVLDRTGVTGSVGGSRKGLTPCRYSVIAGARRFVAASAVILAPDAGVPRATLAHELFHSVQCILGGSGAGLVQEGTAEWFGALAEPADFAGQVVSDAGGITVTGGATRAISFCQEFDPARINALDIYNSWAVWTALDIAAPGSVLQAIRTAGPSAHDVMSAVGDARWSAALLVAVQEVCGNLRTPGGLPAFAPEIRDFFPLSRAVALPGTPATVTAPAGGAISVVADWSATAPAGSVIVRVTAPGIDPAILAGRLLAQVGTTPVPITSDPSGALITLTGAQVAAGRALVTIASPSIGAPTALTTEVSSTP